MTIFKPISYTRGLTVSRSILLVCTVYMRVKPAQWDDASITLNWMILLIKRLIGFFDFFYIS